MVLNRVEHPVSCFSYCSAGPSVIVTRQVPPLSCFKSATVHEILCLLEKAPAKSCELDPVPTWLLKQLAPYIAPTICLLCNLLLKSGIFPAQLNHASVRPLLRNQPWTPMIPAHIDQSPNFFYLSKLLNVSSPTGSVNT